MVVGTWALVITLTLGMEGVTQPPWARGIGALPIEFVVGGLPSQAACMEGARVMSAWAMEEHTALAFRSARCVAVVAPAVEERSL